MNDIRYFTKQLLIEYNNAAIREKRNRAIKEEVLENLTEGFIFPITRDFYHGKDEVRVMISLFEVGTAFLDMTNERYFMLPIAKWNEKTQEYIFEDENEIRKKFPYKNREWTEKVVKQPYRRQGKFRKEILRAYNNTCAVCGIKEPKILLKIRPDGKIEIKSEEFKGVYDTILYPQNKEWYPSLEYLKIKYDWQICILENPIIHIQSFPNREPAYARFSVWDFLSFQT